MKATIHKLLPENLNTQTVYIGRKLSTCFQIKDKNKFDHQHELVYHAKCPSELCDENYIGESGIRTAGRVKGHNRRGSKSHILKHSLETGHERVKSSDFSIIYKNFNGNKRKRKIAEFLFNKQLRPTLNIQIFNNFLAFNLYNKCFLL